MFTLPDLRSSTVRVVGLGSLVALLLVACVLAPNAVGATEEGSVPPACGLDVLVVLDDDASLDDSTAPQALRALRALTSALGDTASELTVSDVSDLVAPQSDAVRAPLVVHLTARERSEVAPELGLVIDVRADAALDQVVDEPGARVYRGAGTFDLTAYDVYRTADFAPLEDAVRAAASEPCATPAAQPTTSTTSTTSTTVPVVAEAAPAPATLQSVAVPPIPTPAAAATTTTVTTVAVAEPAPPPAGTIPPVAPAPRAEVHVEQFVNGDDADVAPGATLLVDDRITWTYAVTNFGNVPLHGIVLVDSLGLKPVLVSGDNGDGQLTPTETWTFRAESRVAAGPQSSVATVTALDPSENPARDDDPSYYSGVRRAVIGDIVWNDSDGNAAPGPNETGIPGAHVVITNRATGVRQTLTTDATGGYHVAVEPGDYEVTLDMDTVDGELTTADEFEFTLDEGEWYLGADFGFDDEFEGDESLPLTGRTTAIALRLGAVALAAGAVLLGMSRTARKRAHVSQ